MRNEKTEIFELFVNNSLDDLKECLNDLDINKTIEHVDGETYSLLSFGIYRNVNIKKIKYILDKKPNLYHDGQTAFEVSLCWNRYKILPLLLDAGLSFTQKSKDNMNILERSFHKRSYEFCKIIILKAKEKGEFEELFRTTTETTFIHIGAFIDDINIIKKGLDTQKDRINDLSMEPPLFFAVRNRNISIIKTLVEDANAEINILFNEHTALSSAIHFRNRRFEICSCLETLLSLGANIDLPSYSLNNPLLIAFKFMDKEVLKFLIKRGAKFDTIYHYGITRLMIFSFIGIKEEVKKELEKGKDPNLVAYIKDKSDYNVPITALSISVMDKNEILFNYMIKKVKSVANLSGVLCLFYGSNGSHVESSFVDKIIEIGGKELIHHIEEEIINLEEQYNYGIEGSHVKYMMYRHPLMDALSKNNMERLERLLKLGCNLDREYLVTNNEGKLIKLFPIQFVLEEVNNHSVDLVMKFLNYKCNPNVGKGKSFSPLKIAVIHQNEELIDLLLNYGADPNYQEELNEIIVLNSLNIIENYQNEIENIYPTIYHAALNPICDLNFSILKKIFKYPRKNLIAPSLINYCENLSEEILIWLIENNVELFEPFNSNFSSSLVISLIEKLILYSNNEKIIQKIFDYYANNETNDKNMEEIFDTLLLNFIQSRSSDKFNALLNGPWKENIQIEEKKSFYLLSAVQSKCDKIVDQLLDLQADPRYPPDENAFNEAFKSDYYSFQKFLKLRLRAPNEAVNWAIAFIRYEEETTLEILDMPGIDFSILVQEKYYPFEFVNLLLYSLYNRYDKVALKIISLLNNEELNSYFDMSYCGVNFMHIICLYSSLEILEIILQRGGSLFHPLDQNYLPPIISFIERDDFQPFIKKYLHEIYNYSQEIENNEITLISKFNIYELIKLNKIFSLYSYVLNNIFKYPNIFEYILQIDSTLPTVIYRFPVSENSINNNDNNNNYVNNVEFISGKLSEINSIIEEKAPESDITPYILIKRNPLDFLIQQNVLKQFFLFKEKIDSERWYTIVNSILSVYSTNPEFLRTSIEIIYNRSYWYLCFISLALKQSSIYDEIISKVIVNYSQFQHACADLPVLESPLYNEHFQLKCETILMKLMNITKESLPKVYLDNPRNTVDYLFDLIKGRQKVKKLRVVIVGPAAAGKTSIVKKLIGIQRWSGTELSHYEENFYEGNSFDIQQDKKKKRKGVTDGIDVHQWVPDNTDVEISLWDFAGQEIYYTTHQFFLSAGTLYLIVFNIIRPLREAKILYWLNSIQAKAEGQNVIIVGTHADLLKPIDREIKLKEISNELQQVYHRWSLNFPSKSPVVNIIKNEEENLLLWAIGNKQLNFNLKNVEKKIIKNAQMKENVPNNYISLLQKIISSRSLLEHPILDLSNIIEFAYEIRMDEKSAKRALTLFHEWGEVLYFGNRKNATFHLQQKVCVNPKWLSDVFKTITSFKHIDNTGKYQSLVTKEELENRWRSVHFPELIFPYLIELLERQFQIIVSLPNSINQINNNNNLINKSNSNKINNLEENNNNNNLINKANSNKKNKKNNKKNNHDNKNDNVNRIYLIPSLLSSDCNVKIWKPLSKKILNSSKEKILTSDHYVQTTIEYFREYHLNFSPHGLLLFHL